MARLPNEQAALEFLTSIGSTLAPRFIAGDATAGVLVAEDLCTEMPKNLPFHVKPPERMSG